MKKILAISLAIVLPLIALALVSVPFASANAGPHGDYSALTDSCAGCHRAHTAVATPLLVADETSLCLSCHGTGSTGANTNVQAGLYDNTRGGVAGLGTNADPLHGGGFVKWQWYISDTATYTGVTSWHNKSGSFGDTYAAGAWGAAVSGSNLITGTRGVQSAAMPGGFKCSSCHNPHGSTNWRILNTVINGNPVSVTAKGGITSEVGLRYTGLQHNYGGGVASLCEACHPAYHSTGYTDTVNIHAGERESTRATTGAKYALMEGTGYQGFGDTRPYPLPAADTNNDGIDRGFNCLTCHTAHGTSVYETGFANLTANVVQGPSSPWHSPTGDSALLRLPNRGMCEVCHQK